VVWKAAIRLLAYIAHSTTTLSEFQRSIVHPNVTKLSSALLSLADKQSDDDLMTICLEVLKKNIQAYPTLHRPLTESFSTFCLKVLNGNPRSTSASVVVKASQLYACIHVTGGKVGGAALWRKAMDETIEFTRSAFLGLRVSYSTEGEAHTLAPAMAELTMHRQSGPFF
jgi:hypothetical protein